MQLRAAPRSNGDASVLRSRHGKAARHVAGRQQMGKGEFYLQPTTFLALFSHAIDVERSYPKTQHFWLLARLGHWHCDSAGSIIDW